MPLLSRPRPAESTDTSPSSAARVPLWALAASLATAAGIHLAVGQQHDFAGLHGTFFAVAGILQAVGAAAVVSRRPARGVVALIATASTTLLVTWIVVRTPGFPGGDALAPLAVAAAVAEMVTVVAAVRLLARPTPAPGRIPGIAVVGLVALVAVGSGGFADDDHGDHHHRPEAPAFADATPHDPSGAPGPLRPLPVTPDGDHHDDEDASAHGH